MDLPGEQRTPEDGWVTLPRLLTEHEVAAYLGTTVRSLRELRSRGDAAGPPYMRTTRTSIRYPADELREWVRSRTRR